MVQARCRRCGMTDRGQRGYPVPGDRRGGRSGGVPLSCDLEVTDRFGRLVRLHHSNWQKHVVKRPAIEPYHDQLPVVLSDPDVVIEDTRDGHFHFYRKGLTSGAFENAYLHVVVEYFGEGRSGVIKTCWLSFRVDPRGKPRWMRLPRN